MLTGKAPVREPMVSAHVVIDCAYTANLSREYLLFIDPAEPIFSEPPVIQSAAAVTSAAATPAPAARQSTAATTPRKPTANKAQQTPIGPEKKYRVQPGDSLSQIAERIDNRSIGLWAAVGVIFDANPDAFMNNDPNMLKAGSLLTIPSLDGSQPVVSAAAASSGIAVDDAPQSSSAVSTGQALAVEANRIAEAVPAESVVMVPTETSDSVETTGTGSDNTVDLDPGNDVVYGDNPFVDVAPSTNENIVIPDTALEGPTTESSSPNVPTAVINTTTGESTSSWLMWLAGGFVVFIGLLLFGRRSRDRFDESPIAPLADQPARMTAVEDTTSVEAVASENYNIEDDSPTEENLSLDADLVIGTGLEAGSEVDVSQDFGFAQTTALDIELPFEPEAEDSSIDTLDAPLAITREESILDSEILPTDEDYDMSVIMDATKMPQPEDVTQRDLKAIEIDSEVDDAETDSYTINKEVDLEILAQDYEDEFTQTQALNVELARAAADLSADTDGETADPLQETGVTIEMPPPIATLTELDLTAHLPAHNEDFVDANETGMYETASLNMTDDEFTVEMPAAENDDEMKELDLDDSPVDTKAI